MLIIKNGNGIIGIDGDFNNSQSLSMYYQTSTLVRQSSLVLEEQIYQAELGVSSTTISHTINDPIAQKIISTILNNLLKYSMYLPRFTTTRS